MIGLKIWPFFKVGQANCVLIFIFRDKSFFGYFIIKKENCIFAVYLSFFLVLRNVMREVKEMEHYVYKLVQMPKY